MKKLTTIVFLVILAAVSAFAQTSADEQEILRIHNSLDQAFLKGDIAVFESVLADDYINSSPDGKMRNRARSLEEMRQEVAKPTFKALTSTTDDVKVKISGNMALVTGNWTSTTVPPDNANAEPHKDTGRFTSVYEKRGGKWLLIAEHFSEAPHDRKLMEAQVLKMGLAYAQMIKNNDVASIEKVLADDYLYTDYNGKVRNKTEDLAAYKEDRGKLESVEISDQKVRVISNSSAVETGLVRFKGTDKEGKAFDIKERYTTTWVWRTGRWQIVSDHVSAVK